MLDDEKSKAGSESAKSLQMNASVHKGKCSFSDRNFLWVVHFPWNDQRPVSVWALDLWCEHAGGNLVQLHNTGLSAKVEGAGHKRVPKRVECCSVGRDFSGETAQMDNEVLTGCVRSGVSTSVRVSGSTRDFECWLLYAFPYHQGSSRHCAQSPCF